MLHIQSPRRYAEIHDLHSGEIRRIDLPERDCEPEPPNQPLAELLIDVAYGLAATCIFGFFVGTVAAAIVVLLF